MADIYLVQADDALVSQLSGWLEKRADRVLTFQNGLDAYEQVLLRPPVLVVIDTGTPGLGGLAFCRLIKFRENTPTPSILLLCSGPEDESALAEQVKADAWLRKPVSQEKFEGEVERLLHGSA